HARNRDRRRARRDGRHSRAAARARRDVGARISLLPSSALRGDGPADRVRAGSGGSQDAGIDHIPGRIPPPIIRADSVKSGDSGMLKQAVLCLALGLWAGSVCAETVYVTDVLRLGLYDAPNSSDKPVENLVSGTALEVLERDASYAHVRLADGREGWVKATYLVTDKPASARV